MPIAPILDHVDDYNVAYEERRVLAFEGEIMLAIEGEAGAILLNPTGCYFSNLCNFSRPC